MSKTNQQDVRDTKRLLVKQVAASPYLSRSSRLRDMFFYVCARVLDESAEEIHEQEVGQEVFGRSADYDTAADNTVRVHASMLRKRVNQYFENEGAEEPLIIEIPRGNYAPVFRERPPKPAEAEPSLDATASPSPELVPESIPARPSPLLWAVPSAFAVLFAITSLILWSHGRTAARPAGFPKPAPAVAALWSQLFPEGHQTDLVLGDATLSVVQERLDRPVSLTEYFDRSYLADLNAGTASTRLETDFAKAMLLKRQVNYGDVALLARMSDMARAVRSDTKVRFARDYSFRELKTDNAVLFGNLNSNPWLEPFRNRETLRWKYDAKAGAYYPIDTAASPADQDKFHAAALSGNAHENYATLSLLPNLSGTGFVLILSGTGGTAMNAALDFLCDERSVAQLHAQLAPKASATSPLPPFEVLIRPGSRTGVSRDTSIVLARRISQ